jgi:hypothetical protein
MAHEQGRGRGGWSLRGEGEGELREGEGSSRGSNGTEVASPSSSSCSLAPNPPGFRRSVYACRAAALTLIIGAYTHAEQLDASVAYFWSWARETRLMRWDTVGLLCAS